MQQEPAQPGYACPASQEAANHSVSHRGRCGFQQEVDMRYWKIKWTDAEGETQLSEAIEKWTDAEMYRREIGGNAELLRY